MRRSTLIASLLFSILTLFFSGCVGRPQPAEPVATDKTLPQVHINGYLSDTHAIAFEWKPVTDPRIIGVRIYRDAPGSDDKALYRIAAIDNTLQTHYIDQDLTPATRYRYRFTTVDAQGRESMPHKTITAKTLSLPEPVSFFTATKELARSAKLIWRPHPDLRVTGYEIERKDPDEEHFALVDHLEGRLNAEYIDSDLDDNKLYRYRIVALTGDGERTAPSKIVTVSTKPLPIAPQHVNASKGEIAQIRLEWSPSATKGINYYNVYRAEKKDGYYEYHAKVARTRFTDKTQQDGVRYFYKVTAVDKDGLESLPSTPVAGTNKAAPAAPELLGLSVNENAVVIRWKPTDKRAVAYEIDKQTHSGWFDTKKARISNIKTTSFTDVNVVPGRTYEYAVIAVDADGMKSDPSASKTITPEAP